MLLLKKSLNFTEPTNYTFKRIKINHAHIKKHILQKNVINNIKKNNTNATQKNDKKIEIQHDTHVY